MESIKDAMRLILIHSCRKPQKQFGFKKQGERSTPFANKMTSNIDFHHLYFLCLSSLLFSLIGLYYVNRISSGVYGVPAGPSTAYGAQKKQK